MTILEERDAAQTQLVAAQAKITALEGSLTLATGQRDAAAQLFLATEHDLTMQVEALTADLSEANAKLATFDKEVSAAAARKAQSDLAAVGVAPVDLTPTNAAGVVTQPISGDDTLASYRKLVETDPAKATQFFRENKTQVLAAMSAEEAARRKQQSK